MSRLLARLPGRGAKSFLHGKRSVHRMVRFGRLTLDTAPVFLD
ncbi:hypothetical protein FHS21_004556 [Phyllobacterium trifolii]|uniref:Uncharacterized protein n=1 Tax=Phyllobacterium trifolii TaxID=300193 RepID=A0A839UE75_9HYPH|nr:hypothetical protein [Phyllobacterium trifolii]